MNLIEANHIVKKYANHTALDDVTVHFPEGAVFGLLGPNGAGKTSLIRIITQITAPDSGTLLFKGKPITREDIYQMGYLPEERGLYKKMKVGEQAMYLAQLKGLSAAQAREKLKYWFKKFDLNDWWDKKVEELSKGMAQKVQFITTILHEPKFLILDEPFSGFDPINSELLKNEILELKAKGTTIVLSTHNMGSVEEICDNIALIHKSRKMVDGAVSDVRKQYSTDTFELNFKGDADRMKNQLTERFVLEAVHENKLHQQAIISLHQGAKLNDLIANVLPNIELLSVKERIPSMSDIFISVVKGKGFASEAAD